MPSKKGSRSCGSFAFVLPLALTACGFATAGVAIGMGGGGSSDSDPIPLRPSPTPLQSGRVFLANTSGRIEPGQTYPCRWKTNGGDVVATGRTRGIGPRDFAVFVPVGLPAGAYIVEVELGVELGQIVVTVGSATPPPAAEAYLDEALGQWLAYSTAARTAAADLPLAARLARTADLDRLDTWLGLWSTGRTTADAATRQALAELVSANADLTQPIAESAAPGIQAAIDASAAAKLRCSEGLAALVGAAIVGDALSGSARSSPMPGATAQILGLIATLRGLDALQANLLRPMRPVAGLAIAVRGDQVTTVIATKELPLRLTASATMASLSAADATNAAHPAASVFADLRDVTDLRAGLPAETSALVGSVLPTVQAQSNLATMQLDPRKLSTANAIQLQNGWLDAASAPLGTSQVAIRYEDPPFAALETSIQTTLIELRSDLRLRPIHEGTFQMGSAAVGGTALPVHQVTISTPFWLGETEVSQASYQQLMGVNPSQYAGPDAPLHPVESVTWHDAMAYCAALSVAEAAAGRLPTGYMFRLPTEAEWECACRAGTTTEFAFGAELVCNVGGVPQANFRAPLFPNHVCQGGANGSNWTIGNGAPNGLGLRDMHGNLWEWCLDSWDGTSGYSNGAVTDPVGTNGAYRVVRGGCWDTLPSYCRSSHRDQGVPNGTAQFFGFRIALAPLL